MDNGRKHWVRTLDDHQPGVAPRRPVYGSSLNIPGRLITGIGRVLVFLSGFGLLAAERAGAQEPSARPAVPVDPAAVPAEALSVRYRFIERYAVSDNPEKPELVSQYQVGLRATNKFVTEKPQGAPDRSETSSQMIYTERPAKVTKLGEVTDAVRRYDTFRLKSMSPMRQPKPPWFEGLTIWYHRRPGQDPLIESLTDGRPLRELEYDQIVLQLFLPQLMAVLPQTPVRVGDAWHISPAAARNLICETPDPENYVLDGTLTEIRNEASANALTAVIEVSGQFDLAERQCSVGTRILFNFQPKTANTGPGRVSSSRTADAETKATDRIVDAVGWISKLTMTQTAAYPLPESDNRLKEQRSFELHLERRRQPTGANDGLLAVPGAAPVANEDNSWPVYDDPQGQFHLRHPQELRIEPRLVDSNILGLVDRDFRGSYFLVFELPPKDAGPERDRQSRDPDYFRRTVVSAWEKQKLEVVAGPAVGWLPEADWLPFKRKVYRIEAATRPPGSGADGQRHYRDYYLVLFPTNRMLRVTAITPADHLKFREQVEAVIKSFDFGPSKGQP